MSVIKIKNENGVFVNIPVIQGEQGIPGENGTSVNVVQATNETEAISLSTANPNNIYYWSEE